MIFSQALIAAVFTASAVGKVRDRSGFTKSIGTFKVVPDSWLRFVAPLLLAAEVTTVALLCAGVLPAVDRVIPLGLGLGVLLLVTYTAGLISVRVRKMHVNCHCFGATTVPVSWYDVVRNAVLVAGAALGLAAGVPADRPAATDAILIALIALAAALVITNLSNVVNTAIRVGGTD